MLKKSSLVSDKVIKIIGQEEWNNIHDEESDICTTTGELIITLKDIAELEKENAELKEQCSLLADCNTCHSSCKNENAEMNKQLAKAKKLLTRFVMASVYFNGKETDLVEEAEQFLRELEE